MSEFWNLIKGGLMSVSAYMVSQLYPIHDFLRVIIILATVNIIFGWYADVVGWSFKKAFKAFFYLAGYITLLILILVLGTYMHLEHSAVNEATSWTTWVMIYFYTVNILRNWHNKQPDNQVIALLYWLLTFKIFERIKYLKEFKEYQSNREKENNDNK